MSFKRMFKNLDIFGLSYELNINKNNKLKTTAGANLTILFIVIIIVLFIRYGIQFYYRNNPNIVLSQIVGDYEIKPLDNSNFFFAFRIEDTLGNLYNDTSIIQGFDVKINEYLKNSALEWVFNSTNSLKVKFEKCDQLISNQKKFNFKKWNCINFSSINNINGFWDANVVRFLEINTLQSPNCSSGNLDQYKNVINNLYFSYLYVQAIPRMSNYSNPLPKILVNSFDNLDINTTKTKIQLYKTINMETDYGWIFSNKKNSTLYSLDYQLSDFVMKYQTNNLLHSMQIFIGNYSEVYTKSYAKIQELLAQIGGFLNIFYISILFLYDSISELIKYRKLMKKIRGCNLKLNEKLSQSSLKCDLKSNNNDSNEKSFNIELGQINNHSERNIQSLEIPKKLTIEKEQNKTISFLIYLKSFCMKKKMTISEKAIVDEFYQNKRYFEKVLDVVSLIKLYKEFEYLKKLILNDYQIIALKLIKPNFSIEEDEASLHKKIEKYFEENQKIDEIDKKLSGFFANEEQNRNNSEEKKITKMKEKSEINKELNSKLHMLINE